MKTLEAREKELVPLLTDDFLSTLKEAVKVCGWSVDHIESSAFVRWSFELAGKGYLSFEDLYPYELTAKRYLPFEDLDPYEVDE